MTELKVLIGRRGQLKASLTRFVKFIHEVKENDDNIIQIKIRKEKIEEVWNEFEQVQSAIENESEDIETQVDQRVEFEDAYFRTVAIAEKYILKKSENNYETPRHVNNSSFNNDIVNIQAIENRAPVKLAALNVPEFSGNYHEWSSFYDCFTSLVDKNPVLSEIQKFFYLRAALSGDALNCIQCLETTANNYQTAWELLIKRFNNKKILVQTHVKAIYDVEKINIESAAKLRQFIDKLMGHIRALETLGHSPKAWGPLLTHVIMIKLDKMTLRSLEIDVNKDDVATPYEIIEFLESRVKTLESIETARSITMISSGFTDHAIKYPRPERKILSKSTALPTTVSIKCYVCASPHSIYRCPIFGAMSIQKRIAKINELKLCRICLRQHADKKCMSRNCVKCSKPHNVLLHYPRRALTSSDEENKVNDSASDVVDKSVEQTETVAAVSVNIHSAELPAYDQVILSTAIINVYDDNFNRSIQCRVLLDSGAQSNFITESAVQLLKLKKTRISHTIIGIGGNIQNISSSVIVRLSSRINDFCAHVMCLVVPRITYDLPARYIDYPFAVPNNIKLADPEFRHPRKVDLLLGASHFFDVLESKQLKTGLNRPVIQKTQFGWVVSGPVPEINGKVMLQLNSSNFYASTEDTNVGKLENVVTKFWRLEEVQKEYPYTREERLCKEHFDKFVTRDGDGRFVVQFAFHNSVSKLGSSYEIAKRRLIALERRLKINEKLKIDYIKFMSEYEQLGHMERVKDENPNIVDFQGCYLPHHAVINENSVTTKLRVVFDASCKTSSGISLNEVLLKGPTLQDELIYILARFRSHKFVITADITKMYRQIKVTENQRDYQRILWREDPSSQIKIFKLTTVTYGTVPASFLATGCLQKLAEIEQINYPRVCEAIKRDFYMDDFLSGASTIEEVIELREGLITVLGKAGMQLTKWSTNEPKIVRDIVDNGNGTEDKVKTWSTEKQNKMSKILGLHWNAKEDTFQYRIKIPKIDTITKRNILACIASVFDPLGFIGPVILRGKLLIQELWQLNLGWDTVVPHDVINKWNEYKYDLQWLNDIAIKRQYTDIEIQI